MRKIIAILLIGILSLMALPVSAKTYDDNMRAVWISTVYNLDYPNANYKNNVAAQQNEFIQKLDELQAIGINTVVVQVRPKADALYASSINPWSDVLTGIQGKYPGYDPLAFMIEAAHSRGMELHAWLNPYRVTTSGTDFSALCETHPARLNPSWTFSYNNALYYNPEVEGVKQHIVDTVKEIVTNYDVDGIHFDDYFYPSNYPLPSGEGKDGTVANARREAINDMVSRVSSTIKSINSMYNKSVKFGISPPGIWKNSSSDATGSNTSGREAYYAVYADTRTWIQNEWIDYIVPQIYWKIGHSKADYATLVKWWSNEVSGTNVKLYIGQGIYTDDVAAEIDDQLKLNASYSAVKGSMYFSLRDLLNNRQGCKNLITSFYKSTNTGTTTPGTSTGGNTSTNPSPGTNTGGSDSSGNNTITLLEDNIGKVGTVNVANLNIRAGARVDRDVVAQVTLGTKVSILDVLNGWYKVKLSNGTVGWVSSEYITPSNETNSGTTTKPIVPISYPATGKITATTLNIRAGARTDRPVVATASKGTKVTVADKLGDWYKVKLSNGTVGWASSAYISIISTTTDSGTTTKPNSKFPRTATVTATTLNIRAGARTDRAIVAKASKGTKVTLLDELGDWYKLKLSNGTVGWAVKEYIA